MLVMDTLSQDCIRVVPQPVNYKSFHNSMHHSTVSFGSVSFKSELHLETLFRSREQIRQP